MGTRHLTVFKDEYDKEIVVMYGQFDGYLSGYGKDLKNFLNGFYVVNGYTLEDENVKSANGISCLAAQVIAHFKKEGIKSSFHILPAGERDCGEEYVYMVYCPLKFPALKDKNKDNRKLPVYIKVNNRQNKLLFDGPVSEFNPLKEEEKE